MHKYSGQLENWWKFGMKNSISSTPYIMILLQWVNVHKLISLLYNWYIGKQS